MQSKKVAAVVIGAIMACLSFSGAALAAENTLGDFPAPFVKDSTPNFVVAVGSAGTASGIASDMVGAIDIAARLGGETVTTTGGDTGAETISSGVQLKASANDLNYGDTFTSVDSKLKSDDLPTILPDGTVKDDGDTNSGTEYDYEQYIETSSDSITYLTGMDTDEYTVNTDLGSDEVPVLGVDMSSGRAWTLTVEFDDSLDAPNLADSETIEIAGKTFTFDPDMSSGDGELTMYAAEETQTVGVGDTKTVTKDGTDITMEVIGANTDTDEATVKVNGETKQVSKGDTVSVGGESVYINQIFMQTIPSKSAQVQFFVGSEKVVLQESNSYDTVEVGGEDIDGLESRINYGGSADIDAIDQIDFRFKPTDMQADEKDYLEIGETVADPLFGTFKIDFSSVVPTLKSSDKVKTELKRSGSNLEITFTNRDGEEYAVTPYTGDSSVVSKHSDWSSLDTTTGYDDLAEDKIIVLQEGTGDSSYITKVYELYDVDSSDNEVTFKDLSDGSKVNVDAGEQIEDTGTYVCDNGADSADKTGAGIETSDSTIDLTDDAGTVCNGTSDNALESVDNTLYTDNDMKIIVNDINDDDDSDYGAITAADDAVVSFHEAQASNEDETKPEHFGVKIDSTTNNDIEIKTLTADSTTTGTLVSGSDDDSNVEYGLTEYGTYLELEQDDNGEYMYVWTPSEEQDFNLYFAPTEATISGGATGEVTRTGVIKNSIASVDTGVTTSQKNNKHLILVGGPAVNKLTAEALNLDFPTHGAASGIPEDGYMIKLVNSAFSEGQDALVVAGWTAEQTQSATAKVQANMADMTGTEYYNPSAPATNTTE